MNTAIKLNRFASRTGSKTASQIARDAIPLLEAEIKRRFGLSVKMGAELEFSIVPTGAMPEGNDPLSFGVDDQTIKNNKPDQRPLSQKADFPYHGLMGRSPAICYAYREGPKVTDGNTYKYEYVFTHDTGEDLQFLADEIADTKCIMQGKPPRHRNTERVSKNASTNFPKAYWKRVFFDPQLKWREKTTGDPVTHGLHFNVSVCEDDGDMLSLDAKTNVILKDELSAAIGEVMYENMLAVDSENSFRRRRKGFNRLHDDCILDREKETYVENRLCDAMTNPHVGVMLHLVAVLHLLAACEYDPSTHEFQREFDGEIFDKELACEPSGQKSVFLRGSIAVDILNELGDERWGDAYREAVLRGREPEIMP